MRRAGKEVRRAWQELGRKGDIEKALTTSNARARAWTRNIELSAVEATAERYERDHPIPEVEEGPVEQLEPDRGVVVRDDRADDKVRMRMSTLRPSTYDGVPVDPAAMDDLRQAVALALQKNAEAR